MSTLLLIPEPEKKFTVQVESDIRNVVIQAQTLNRPESRVEYRTITTSEAHSQSMLLTHPLTNPSKLTVDVASGGGALFPGIDFEILGNSIAWAGLAFDGLLESGDRIRIIYE